MPTVRPLTTDDFPAAYSKYLSVEDAQAPVADWRTMFELSARRGEPCGYGLFEGEQLVGMLGTLFSIRTVQENEQRFCNLYSWHVDPSARGFSLMLLRPVLSRTDHTLTDLTPTEQVSRIVGRIGFSRLDTRMMVLFPRRIGKHASTKHTIVSAPDRIAAQVTESERRLLDDHPTPKFVHLWAESSQGGCLIIASRITRHWLAYCQIEYLSQPEVFRELNLPIRHALRESTQGRFVAVAVRRIGDSRLPSSIIVPASVNQFFRSQVVLPRDVDWLYSEVAFLQLTTLPGAKRIMKRVLGFGKRET